MKLQSVFLLARRFAAMAFVSAGLLGTAQAAQSPTQFVEQIANQTLEAVKQNTAARSGNITAINEIVNNKLMPYLDFQKTTRLATGQPWRQATPEQKTALTAAFKNTLVRTYSGAFKQVSSNTRIDMQPFRGNPNANDVVVRSTIISDSGPVAVDYRLEKSGDSWKVYDFSVEGIWLIQNYRNQFASQIAQNGIDGLINALNQRK
ncbi:MlaC/ttg2D family ABC transporter substrate-binding protein [Advenella alkanexedens]|uniref:MlaC/ttg2D family ABC transporter substrate-binding protein n=1 Tax=Advenella alkanexedens TaxID=1481665 RepID=UPI002676EF1D|nr:ABC transporter substrate-binding protein [Advenella alkanexedens]WKU19419.1 ABC transporter substrate-binding protein [Advenella alkanexedens]